MARPSRESWVLVGLALLPLAAAAVLLYVPQGRKLDNLRSTAASLELSLEEDTRRAAAVPGLLREIDTMKRQYKDFDRRLPKDKELGGFLGEISSNLADENLSDPEILPGNPSAEDLFHTLPIVMKCRGSYLPLAGFLQRIARMQRLTRVHTLKIERDPKSEQHRIVMQLNIYFTQT